MALRPLPCGVVFELEDARRARDRRELIFEQSVAQVMGNAGVWPDDIELLVKGLARKVGTQSSPWQVANELMRQIGWDRNQPLDSQEKE